MELRHGPTALWFSSAALLAAWGLAGAAAPQPPPTPDQTPAPIYANTPTSPAVVAAVRLSDGPRLRGFADQTADPLARKIALWSLADSAPDLMNWPLAEAARTELADWPRPTRRRIAAEKWLDRSGLSAAETIAWFGESEPLTIQGAAALAGALRQGGQTAKAATVLKKAWRGLTFDTAVQADMLARFSDLLTTSDHVAREDFLLYGVQGDAAQSLLQLLPADDQAVARVRMAVRGTGLSAQPLIDALPAADQVRPGLVFERVLALRDHGDTAGALALIPYLPTTLPDDRAAERLWKRGALMVAALQGGDTATAYQVAAHSGLTTGSDAANAQFYAGWIALARLKDPQRADLHFAKLEQAGASPLTQSRALYWRGRAAEAEGDVLAAQIFYQQAAHFPTTFYGQLAATKGGGGDLILGHDPDVDVGARARFEASDVIRAARLFGRSGSSEMFRGFVLGLSESLATGAAEAMLVDLAREQGDQDLSMRVVRNAAKRGFILPERGYPVRSTPSDIPGSAEAPLVLSITRQESSFDPNARSGVGARGMMQLMPATAQSVARRSGLGWGDLSNPDFNMKVGSVYLGQLVGQFSGSYVMAAAAYNAGPSRPIQWAQFCGDPRSASTDPLDFIECIPFSETRDYVMRVMETTQVYRARLSGGTAPNTLAQDLRRGAYGADLTAAANATHAPVQDQNPGPAGR